MKKGDDAQLYQYKDAQLYQYKDAQFYQYKDAQLYQLMENKGFIKTLVSISISALTPPNMF